MIEVLKQAIDYIENVPDDRDSAGHIDRDALVLSLNQAIAELESQESVGWLVEFENGEQELHFDKQSVGETQNPLYTHPPQRTWVGLTDEEMMDAIYVDDTPMERGRRVEAKLKEKNT